MSNKQPAEATTPEAVFWAQIGTAMIAESEAVGALLNKAHAPTEGALREGLVRKFLRRTLPERYAVSTGFVRWPDAMSRQIDVLVWDRVSHSPLFIEGDLVVVEPAACVAVIEVKTTLTRATLFDALSVIHHPGWENVLNLPVRSPIRGVFAFRSRLRSSEALVQWIADYYRQRLAEKSYRLCMQIRPPKRLSFPGDSCSRLGEYEMPRFPELVDLVTIVGEGLSVSQASHYVNDETFPGYDPLLRVSSHQERGRCVAESAAILQELLGRTDPRTQALDRRSRLRGNSELWALGAENSGERRGAPIRRLRQPLWARPFQPAGPAPLWDRQWPLKLGRPRDTMTLRCAASSGCVESVASDREARERGWQKIEFSNDVDDTLWFCTQHATTLDTGAVLPAILSVMARK